MEPYFNINNANLNAHFATGLNAADAADVEQGPGGPQNQNDPPLQTSGLVDARGGVQSLPVPEVVHSAAAGAL